MSRTPQQFTIFHENDEHGYPFVTDLNRYHRDDIIAFFTDFIIKMGFNILDRFVAIGKHQDYVVYQSNEMYMMHDSG